MYYLIAAVFTGLAILGRYTKLSALAAVVYFIGVVAYMPGWNFDSVLLLREPKMHSIEVELAREAFGLLICAVWMSVLSVCWLKKRDRRLKEEAPGDADA